MEFQLLGNHSGRVLAIVWRTSCNVKIHVQKFGRYGSGYNIVIEDFRWFSNPNELPLSYRMTEILLVSNSPILYKIEKFRVQLKSIVEIAFIINSLWSMLHHYYMLLYVPDIAKCGKIVIHLLGQLMNIECSQTRR